MTMWISNDSLFFVLHRSIVVCLKTESLQYNFQAMDTTSRQAEMTAPFKHPQKRLMQPDAQPTLREPRTVVTKDDMTLWLARILALVGSATSRPYWIRTTRDDEDEMVGEIRWYATSDHKDWLSILVYAEGFQLVSATPNTGFWNDWNDPDHIQRTHHAISTFLES